MRPKIMLPGVLWCLLFAAVPALCGESGFPLSIGGQTMTVDREAPRADIEAALRRIWPDEQPSVQLPDRIQYDVIVVPGQGPVSLTFDFDARGRLVSVVIDAMLKEQNPVAVQLAAWLRSVAGKGVRKKGDTVWNHAGLQFRLREVKMAGEDSMYCMSVDRLGR